MTATSLTTSSAPAAAAVVPLDGRFAGTVAHVVIADLLQGGARDVNPHEIRRLVAEHPRIGKAKNYRAAARQTVSCLAGRYLTLFDPGAAWTLEATEQLADHARFDVVWQAGERHMVDEIKTGHLHSVQAQAALTEQLARELAAGTAEWGKQFAGVRVVVLAAPRQSFLATPDGARAPLTWAELEATS